MAKTEKATRYELTIGDIKLSSYLMPDGETVKLSGRDVTGIIEGMGNKRLNEFYRVKSLKDLPHADSRLSQIRTNVGKSFIPVAVEDAISFWNSRCGEKGKRLVEALAIESIEQRTRKKAGIELNEEELNLKLKARLQHKKQYHPLLTKWLQKDGCCESWQYAFRVNEFKKQSGLPLTSIEEYSAEDMIKLNQAEVRYDTLRKVGINHFKSLDLLSKR